MAAAPLPTAKPIVLVGLMGAGKSTVGPPLAARLGLPFSDADAEVEREAGLGIGEIFERFGEAHFRERERRAVARLAAGAPRVIAAGGGAFADEGTRRLILERCTAVWLDADLETLAKRVGAGDERPLVAGGDVRRLLADLAERRRPAYAQAPIRVDTGACSPGQAVDAIVAALAERQR